jgi:hypothetical protein
MEKQASILPNAGCSLSRPRKRLSLPNKETEEMSGFTRFGIVLAGGLLAGCGALPGSFPSAGMHGSGSDVREPAHTGSWMAKGLKQRDLLYVSNGNGTVNVYRYWQHTLVGVLTDFTKPLGECSNQAGDVFIADVQKHRVDEYAHGGTKPVDVLNDSPYNPYGCSVAPSAGDVAVANYGHGRSYYGSGNVAVYPPGSSQPTIYAGSSDDHFVACAYDDRGDLLATSQYGYYTSDRYARFYYLPKHGTQLLAMDLPGPSRSWEWGDVLGLAWDGKYWVVFGRGQLYRYSINVKAQYVDTIELGGTYSENGPVAIYRKTLKSQGTQVVGSSDFNENSVVEYWKYPDGGSPVATITKDLDAPYGLSISLGTP